VRTLSIAMTGLVLSLGLAQAEDWRGGQSLPDYKGQKFEVVGDSGAVTSATTITSPTGFTALTSVPMYPVLYCGEEGGGGTNEYAVRPGAGPVRWLLEVPSPPSGPPAGAKMFDVRYEAYDNVAAIGMFARILVEKVDDSHVSITAQAYPNCERARVRLRLTILFAK
jgi:hypothetical protein